MARIFDIILFTKHACAYASGSLNTRETQGFLPQFSCDPSEGKEVQEGSMEEGEEGKSFGLALGKVHQ